MAENRTKVLLVEDTPEAAELINELINRTENNEFEIVWAKSLSTGIERIKKGDIKIILLDLGLPDSTGIKTFEKMYSQASQIPIVILTCMDDEDFAIETVHKGAQDYLVKNRINGRMLVRVLRHTLERYQMHVKLQQFAYELKIRESRLRTLIETNADGIVIVDKNGNVVFINPATEKLFNKQSEEIINKSFGYPIVIGKKTEIEIINKENESITVEMRVVEIEWDNEPAYLLSLRDISELVRLREELRTMSMHDELTGLYNRRGFLALGNQQLKLCRRSKRNLFLIYMDMDDLKIINDLFGHTMGDNVLKEAADVLRNSFRESDIIARIGGDEFAVLALESQDTNSKKLRNRLKRNFDLKNKEKNRCYPLSLSIGIKRYNKESHYTVEDLITPADILMYREKRKKKVMAVK